MASRVFVFFAFAICYCSCHNQTATSCRYDLSDPDTALVVADCQRTHVPDRILSRALHCLRVTYGRDISLEEYLADACLLDDSKIRLDKECMLATERIYMNENREAISAAFDQAEVCVDKHAILGDDEEDDDRRRRSARRDVTPQLRLHTSLP